MMPSIAAGPMYSRVAGVGRIGQGAKIIQAGGVLIDRLVDRRLANDAVIVGQHHVAAEAVEGDRLMAPGVQVEAARIGRPGGGENAQGLVESEDLPVDLFGEGQRLVGQRRGHPRGVVGTLRMDRPHRADPGQRDQGGGRDDDARGGYEVLVRLHDPGGVG